MDVDKTNIIDWGKELWLGLLFLCIGFTVWPLLCYYLGRTLELSFFLNLHLKTWAESIVYGPLAQPNLRGFLSLLFLLFPMLVSFFIRFSLSLSRRNQS